MAGIVFNEDFENFFSNRPVGDMNEAGLRRQIADYVAAGGIAQFNFCGNGMRTIYESGAFEAIFDGLEEQPDGTFLSRRGERITNKLLPVLSQVLNCRELCRNVPDHLQKRIAIAREYGCLGFLSMRMNDLHIVSDPDCQWNSDFWLEHPEFRRAPYQSTWPGQGLDYAEKQVYAHFMALAAEYLERFDLDGLELDWMRTPPFFRPGADVHNRHILTRFMREVKALARQAETRLGHKVALAVRVPNRPDDARRLGMDVKLWVDEGLIDQLTVCSYWGVTDFDPPLELWRWIVGDRCRLFAGLELICRSSGRGETSFFHTPEIARGFAASFLHRGADAIYLFNHMDGHCGIRDKAGQRKLYGELGGAQEELEKLSRRHVVTYADPLARAEGVAQDNILPMQLNRSTPALRINIGGGLHGHRATVLLGSLAEDADWEKLPVRLNGIVLRQSPELHLPELPPSLNSFARYEIDAELLYEGDNLLEFRMPEGSAIELEWCEIDLSATR